jgi:aryl sulfotransferase
MGGGTPVTKPAIAGTRVYRHHHLDSTRWEHIDIRDDDIVVTTPYKRGTTWTQFILNALILGTDKPFTRHETSPWIDARFNGPIEPIAAATNALPHRRFLKSHLALDGMVWDARIKYVVVGRDSRDVFMSLLNHYAGYSDFALSLLNDAGNPGPPIPRFDGDVHRFWHDWMTRGWFEWEDDGWPFWSHHHHLATWWTARHLPNVVFLHYADLKADAPGEIRRLADFLGIAITPEQLAEVVRVTDFDHVRQEAIAAESRGGVADGGFFEGGVATFLYKGTNGRWRDVLTEDELAQYAAKMDTLDPGLVHWLEGGRRAAEPNPTN